MIWKQSLVAFIFLSNALSAQNKQADSLLTSIYPNDQPGVSVIIKQHGKTLYQKSTGIANLNSGTAISSATNFNICSLTKQMTAYAIVELALQKKLSLNDPICKFLPGISNSTGQKITIKHLLSHSSGLIDHYNLVDRKAFRHFLDKDAYEAIKQIDSTYFPAGSSYRYSNTAFCLLALVIEKVSGKSYPDYMQQSIFRPLQMNHSLIRLPDSKILNQALGYDYEPTNKSFKLNDINESIFFSTMGDGGVYTSINDYIKWVEAIRTGKGINPEITRLTLAKQNPVDRKRDLHYGFGWFVSGQGKDRCYYHTGSNGGFRTIVYINPAAAYSLVIFSNRTGVDLEELAKKLNNLFGIDNHSFIPLEDLIS